MSKKSNEEARRLSQLGLVTGVLGVAAGAAGTGAVAVVLGAASLASAAASHIKRKGDKSK